MTHAPANLAEPPVGSGPAAWGAVLFDAHPHAILVIDSSGRLQHANRAAQWLVGGCWLHKSLFDLLELPADPATGVALRAALRDGDEWTGMLGTRSAERCTEPVCLHLLAAPKAETERVCLVECRRLDRQQAEPGQARRIDDLRQGHFLAGLSHELRSALAPISNAASVLRTVEDGNATLLRLREILERQVARIRRVLDELVDVTQALQGEMSLVRRPVSLNEVLDSALAQSEQQLDAMGQQVTLRLPPRAVVLEGDSVRLAQMFSALLGNASRFSPAAAPIAIGVDLVDASVTISIKDSGRGMSAFFLPQAFDLFAQEMRERKGALGIGLTLARRIAQFHGGDVQAHSDGPDAGSEFVVTLPLIIAQHDR
ncbi:MAG: ATP-binding protein [Burkholderiaceae bacterium]